MPSPPHTERGRICIPANVMCFKDHLTHRYILPAAIALLAACNGTLDPSGAEEFDARGRGVFVLNEGNYQAGNSTLSYYRPDSLRVENGIFLRANSRRLGDTGQSITIYGETAYIAVENSGIIWAIDTETFRVKGQLEAGETEWMVNPRYVYVESPGKAYATDLLSPYITIFNPSTMTYLGSIATGQKKAYSYASTERIVPYGHELFVNCWCYSRSILVVDTRQEAVTDSIVLSSWQPKSMAMDCRGKLWVITDGGYGTERESFGDNVPHLYCIDAATHQIESDEMLDTDEASVEIALNPGRDTLYIINNDIFRMGVGERHVPVRPFIEAPRDSRGRRHKLYGLNIDPHSGDLYVADAVDYSQSGVVYRYSNQGQLIDQFRVGINPNGFAFK